MYPENGYILLRGKKGCGSDARMAAQKEKNGETETDGRSSKDSGRMFGGSHTSWRHRSSVAESDPR